LTGYQSVFISISPPNDLVEFELPFGLPEALNPEIHKASQRIGPYAPDVQDFAERATDEFLLLDASYHSKWEEVSKHLMTNHESLLDSWTPEDTGLLYYTICTLVEQSVPCHVTKKNLQTELSRRLFPLKSADDILQQKYRLKMKRTMEEKRNSIIVDWTRDKDELAKETNAAWAAILKERETKEEKLLEMRKQSLVCDKWNKLLERSRKEREQKARELELRAAPFEEMRKKRENDKRIREECYRQSQKEMLQRHNRWRMRLEQEEMEKMMLENRSKEERQKLVNRYNR